MKRLFCLFVATALLLAPRAVRAQDPLGSVAAIYSYNASKVLADPVRSRVYVTDTVSNSVVVIDTTTLKATASVTIGSDPVDMAISPDGNTLYVANGGSTLAAIVLLDLNTLTVSATYPLANPPVAIAAGLSNRLYVSASPDGFSTAIYQLDATTGAVQTTFNSGYYDNNLLTLSVDGKTLYDAENQDEPGDLKSFDVSTATPALAQTNSRISDFPPVLVVSHNGKYLCLPSYSNSTYLYSTADITTYYGSFSSTGNYGSGPLAFSLDDSLVYQVFGSTLDVFSTATFTQVNTVTLPSYSTDGVTDTPNQVVIDNTGSYLFVSTSSYNNSSNVAVGQLTVVTTGTGTLTPSSILPSITGGLSVTGTQNTAFTYQITATGSPTSYAATSLPDGLSVNPATGLISGSPTSYGYYSAQISATNASGTATAYLAINVSYNSAQYQPVVTTTSLPGGTVGQLYSVTIQATNSSYDYEAAGLPDGLYINEYSGHHHGHAHRGGHLYRDLVRHEQFRHRPEDAYADRDRAPRARHHQRHRRHRHGGQRFRLPDRRHRLALLLRRRGLARWVEPPGGDRGDHRVPERFRQVHGDAERRQLDGDGHGHPHVDCRGVAGAGDHQRARRQRNDGPGVQLPDHRQQQPGGLRRERFARRSEC